MKILQKTVTNIRRNGMRNTAKKIIRHLIVIPSFRMQKAFCMVVGKTILMPRYNVFMIPNWNDSTFRFCYSGAYGDGLSEFISKIESDFVFMDIGANQGLYSLIAAKNPNCLRVLSFEPVSDTYRILRRNVSANKVESKICAVQAAISSTTGPSAISFSPAHSGGASMDGKNVESGRVSEIINAIDATDLDRLLGEEFLDAELVVKVDVEGHEDVVLGELGKSIHISRIQAIYYEMDRRWSDPVLIEELLKSYGFTKFIEYGSGERYDILALRQ